jgi:hypothetical protein
MMCCVYLLLKAYQNWNIDADHPGTYEGQIMKWGNTDSTENKKTIENKKKILRRHLNKIKNEITILQNSGCDNTTVESASILPMLSSSTLINASSETSSPSPSFNAETQNQCAISPINQDTTANTAGRNDLSPIGMTHDKQDVHNLSMDSAFSNSTAQVSQTYTPKDTSPPCVVLYKNIILAKPDRDITVCNTKVSTFFIYLVRARNSYQLKIGYLSTRLEYDEEHIIKILKKRYATPLGSDFQYRL